MFSQKEGNGKFWKEDAKRNLCVQSNKVRPFVCPEDFLTGYASPLWHLTVVEKRFISCLSDRIIRDYLNELRLTEQEYYSWTTGLKYFDNDKPSLTWLSLVKSGERLESIVCLCRVKSAVMAAFELCKNWKVKIGHSEIGNGSNTPF